MRISNTKTTNHDIDCTCLREVLECIAKFLFFPFAFGAVDALALDLICYVFSALCGMTLRSHRLCVKAPEVFEVPEQDMFYIPEPDMFYIPEPDVSLSTGTG